MTIRTRKIAKCTPKLHVKATQSWERAPPRNMGIRGRDDAVRRGANENIFLADFEFANFFTNFRGFFTLAHVFQEA
jgi:hypothetical protein